MEEFFGVGVYDLQLNWNMNALVRMYLKVHLRFRVHFVSIISETTLSKR